MAHFAEIKSSNNTVLRVVVINDSDVSDNGGEYTTESENWVSNFIPNDPFILEDNGGNYPTTYWKQTSYNANARGIYAGIGYTYHADVDEFRHPQPFNSWTWDSTDKIHQIFVLILLKARLFGMKKIKDGKTEKGLNIGMVLLGKTYKIMY